MNTPRSLYWGLFFVALATLMYEILLTRIFSVTMYYHFAFVAISIAMFGMTVGALIVYFLASWFPPEDTPRRLAWTAAALPVTMILSFLTQLSIPFMVHPSIVAVYAIGFTYAVVAVPCIVSGIVVSLVLTRFPARISQLYAADLVGAALGCVLLVFVLDWTDGPTAVFAVAWFASLGAIAFAAAAGARKTLRVSVVLSVLVAAFVAGHTAMVWRQFPVLRILYVKGQFEARPLYERWNSYSRVRVNGNPDELTEAYGWGLSPLLPADRKYAQLKMDIDVSAGTVLTKYSGKPEEVDHLAYDITNIGYTIRPGANALVVGTGGGRDVLSALTFGARRVTGVDINRAIIDTLNVRFGGFTGHLDRDPRVRFVVDEARSFIARQREQYDFMQISLIDTWAATAAGAFVLSENSLYTVEAWRTFIRHLTPGGILSVSRWYNEARPGEVYRLLTLARESLRAEGINDIKRHLIIVKTRGRGQRGVAPDGVGTMLLSSTPFSDADIDGINAEADRLGFLIVLSPRVDGDEIARQLVSAQDVSALLAGFPINITAPTDDSPFFFQMLRLRDIFKLDLLQAGKQSANMAAVFILGALLLTVLLLSMVCIVLPLAVGAGTGALRGSGSLLGYFAAIGLGFMLIETSQMQRLIIVLGHPTYGLTVVLFALLLSSGAGSFLTGRLDARGAQRYAPALLGALLVLLVLFGFGTPWIVTRFEASATWLRILVAVLVLAPPGLLMGTAFPIGMKLASSRDEALTPWLWGVNGALSVVASVLAVAIALSWSISAAFWTGFAAYGAALVTYRLASRAPQPR